MLHQSLHEYFTQHHVIGTGNQIRTFWIRWRAQHCLDDDGAALQAMEQVLH